MTTMPLKSATSAKLTDLPADICSVSDKLHRLTQQHAEAWGQRIGGVGSEAKIPEQDRLTPRQFLVLRAIERDPGASQTELVAFTGIDRSTLADIVRRLNMRGYLSRQRRKDDARAYKVGLTAKGQAAVRKFAAPAGEIEQELLTKLNRDERRQFDQLLTKALSKAA